MDKNIFSSVIIVAGGKGKRMKSDRPKQYIDIMGIPILARTIKVFQDCSYINQIIIVVGKDDIEYCNKNIVKKYGFDKVTDIIEGGSERQYSVKNGLSKIDEKADIVLIHDAVRPFIEPYYIESIIKDTLKFGSCVLGVKVKDTIKICNSDGFVCDTPNRSTLWIAQTPQAFKTDIIKKSYNYAEKIGFLGTDDSMLVEKAGYKINMTQGDYDNIKITTHEDIKFAEAIISEYIS